MTKKLWCVLIAIVLACAAVVTFIDPPVHMQSVKMVYEDGGGGCRALCYIEVFSNGTIEVTVDEFRSIEDPYGDVGFTKKAMRKRRKLSKQDRDSINWLISQVKANCAPAEEGYDCETSGGIDVFAVIDGVHYTACYQELGGRYKWLPALAAKLAAAAPDLWYCKLESGMPWTVEYLRYDSHKEFWNTP